MKKITLISTLLVLAVLLAVNAAALSISSPAIGGENQDRIKNATATFTVTNNGNTTLNNIAVSHSIPSEYNARLSKTSIATLAAGAQETITITVDIPLTFNAVEEAKTASDYLAEKAFKIGQVTANDGSTSFNADVTLKAINQLKIKKATLECGDNSQKLDDGDKIKNLKPDMACTLEIEVENSFNDEDNNDQKIGDIDFDPITIEIESLDSDFDVDEDEEIDNLGGEEEDSISIDFDIAEDLDDGAYAFEIRVFADDDNLAFHGEIWTISLDVERLSHDVQIKNPSMTPVKMDSCQDNTLKITSTIINLGRRDEDAVKVEADIPELKISKERTDIVLDKDDSTGVTFNLVVPQGTKQGVYALNINTYFDNLAPSRTETLEFVVEKCEEVPAEVVVPDETQDTDTDAAPGTEDAVDAPRARTRTGAFSSFSDSPYYLWVLGGAGAVLVVFILLLLSVLFRRPPVIE